MRLIDRVLGYLARFPDYALRFERGRVTDPVLYADSAHGVGTYTNDQSGWVIMLAGAAIVWGSKKQTIATTCTTDSEILALSMGIHKGEEIRVALWCMGLGVPTPMTVYSATVLVQ